MYEKKGTLKGTDQKEKQGHKNPETKNNEGHKNEELKSLVTSLVEEAVDGMKSSWKKDMETRIASEREDAARLATMSSEERAKLEMEKKQKDFETEREQYVSERAQFEAAKELAAQNLPVAFAGMLADPDNDTMLQNINAFKTEYLKAIEAGLSERLKGTLPRVSREAEQTGDPFLSGLGM